MTICPRTKSYIGCNLTGIPLRVIQDDGVEYSPHIKFSEIEFETGAKKIINHSGKTDSFSIKILVNDTDTVNVTKEWNSWDSYFLTNEVNTVTDETIDQHLDWIVWDINVPKQQLYAKAEATIKVNKILDSLIRNGTRLYVTTRAIGINSKDLWVITENKTRKQNYDDGYVIWELTFTKYVEYNWAKFYTQNKGVQESIKNYKSKAKSKTASKNKLKKCKISQLKYSKQKKTNKCVKYMQKLLYKKGFLKGKKKDVCDGWFGKDTVTALKNFQKKYKKKFKLKTNGKVDKNTFKALCSIKV